MISVLLLRNIAQLFLIMLMGYFAVRFRVLRVQDSTVLSNIILYVLSPCMLLSVFQIELNQKVLSGLIMAFSLSALVQIFFVAVGSAAKKCLRLSAAEEAAVIYSNAGNLVLPLVIGVFGEEWAIYCSGYIIVQQILLWSHGVSLFSEKKEICGKKILCNINVLTIFAGLLLMITGLKLPELLNETLDRMGGLLSPMAMFTAGMAANEIDWKKMVKERNVYLLSCIRLLVFPVLTVLLFVLLHIPQWFPDSKMLSMIVLMAAMTPTGTTIMQFAFIYGREKDKISAEYIMTLVGCILTMPAITYMYLYIL